MAKKKGTSAIEKEVAEGAEQRGWSDWWKGQEGEVPKALQRESLANAYLRGQSRAAETCTNEAMIFQELHKLGCQLAVKDIVQLTQVQRRELVAAMRASNDAVSLASCGPQWLADTGETKAVEVGGSKIDVAVFTFDADAPSKPVIDATAEGFEAASPLELDEDIEPAEADHAEPTPKAPKAAPAVPPNNFPTPEHPVVLNVEYGGVSFNAETASIGVTVDRQSMQVQRADELFCGRQIDGELLLGNGQMTLPGLDQERVKRLPGAFQSPGLGVKPKYFSFKLRFPLSDSALKVLATFAKKAGRLRINSVTVLTHDSRDDEAGEDSNGQQELDYDEELAAGANRPHGTPALEALAKIKREEADEPDDEDEDEGDSATVPFPTVSQPVRSTEEKLTLCNEQLVSSLRCISVPRIPEQLLSEWSDELRDEVDTWAKCVFKAASGASTPIPPTPEVMVQFLADEQKLDPVAFAKNFKTLADLRYYCEECGLYWPVSDDPRAADCKNLHCRSNRPGVLVGFYGDPRVDAGGVFVCVDEYGVPTPSVPCNDGCGMILRAVEGTDKRWRTSSLIMVELRECDSISDGGYPTIRDPGKPTLVDAITAEVDGVIHRLQKIGSEGCVAMVSDLATYTKRLANGDTPDQIDEELHGDGIVGAVNDAFGTGD